MDYVALERMKEFIRKNKRNGDVTAAAKRIGCTTTPYWTGMNRSDEDYTNIELAFIKEMFDVANERAAVKKSLNEAAVKLLAEELNVPENSVLTE